jgi:AcrR family transcriptional regulator
VTRADTSAATSAGTTAGLRRRVGRPRTYDAGIERELVIDAGYTALREFGGDLTINHILSAAGVSTRSFYRHFASKDALLCAMYRRDAEYVAERLGKRVDSADSPRASVEGWIDEIYAMVRSRRRHERVSVLRSIEANRAEGAEAEAAHCRRLLIAPLQRAIATGVANGDFAAVDARLAAEVIAAAVLHAAGLSHVAALPPLDQGAVTEMCLRGITHVSERRSRRRAAAGHP